MMEASKMETIKFHPFYIAHRRRAPMYPGCIAGHDGAARATPCNPVAPFFAKNATIATRSA
jgi:hypothetical protein